MNSKFHKAKAAAIMTAFVPAFTMANLGINQENFTTTLLVDVFIAVCTIISCCYECETADILQETEQLKQEKHKTYYYKTPSSKFYHHHYMLIYSKMNTAKNTTEYLFYRKLIDMLL